MTGMTSTPASSRTVGTASGSSMSLLTGVCSTTTSSTVTGASNDFFACLDALHDTHSRAGDALGLDGQLLGNDRDDYLADPAASAR